MGCASSVVGGGVVAATLNKETNRATSNPAWDGDAIDSTGNTAPSTADGSRGGQLPGNGYEGEEKKTGKKKEEKKKKEKGNQVGNATAGDDDDEDDSGRAVEATPLAF